MIWCTKVGQLLELLCKDTCYVKIPDSLGSNNYPLYPTAVVIFACKVKNSQLQTFKNTSAQKNRYYDKLCLCLINNAHVLMRLTVVEELGEIVLSGHLLTEEPPPQ